MRTMYQASPWKAANVPIFRSSAFGRHTPERLGDPSAFFSRESFVPTRLIGAPVLGRSLGEGEREGIDITRPVCRCKFAKHEGQLGQGCSTPTAGGSGSAEFGASDVTPSQGPKMETILVAGAVGVGILLLLGVL